MTFWLLIFALIYLVLWIVDPFMDAVQKDYRDSEDS